MKAHSADSVAVRFYDILGCQNRRHSPALGPGDRSVVRIRMKPAVALLRQYGAQFAARPVANRRAGLQRADTVVTISIALALLLRAMRSIS